ncbi:MAG: helix-turn-helix transcriptional regulator [Sandaracinaceae bacterium]|jgi:AraC-like DNA-binding protein|nr:helix-turn-helix transcriptional regulator [Sandaracinaceae bacterium]
MTKAKAPTATPSCSREAFERHQSPVWVQRFRGHEPHAAQPGTFAHTYAVIVLITRGLSRIRHTGDLVLRAGDVHLIPPGDAHGAAHFDDMEGWALAFHPEAFPQDDTSWGSQTGLKLGPLLRVRSGCHPVLRPDATQRRRLEEWMRLVEHELEGDQPSRDDAVSALLRLVLIELERMSGPEPAPEPAGQGTARQALTYIEANALESLSLAQVAQAVDRSPTHVASVMRKETGRTVGQWILEYRMAEARRRLRGTDERVEVIAERVGYADVTHFIRLFRRTHGLTPAAWRRQGSHAAS